MTLDPSMHILIVDDHQIVRRAVGDVLKDLGFANIHYAEDGQIAWDMIQVRDFNLIILDWNMPNMNGMQLLERIRRSEKHAELPVIMLTAEAEKEQVILAILSGVTNYVVKPFTANTLQRKIHEIFKGDARFQPQ